MASEMTVHCTMVGTVLYCPPVVHVLQPTLGTTLSDWVRRAGVFVAVVGTFIAAAEGTAVAWRAIRVALARARTWAAGTWLVRILPFLRRSVTVHGAGAILSTQATMTATATVTPGWDQRASLEARVSRLHEQMDRAYAEIEKARQEVRDGIAELRRVAEQHTGELRAAHRAHQESHAAEHRQAARADARGLWPVGLGIVMTGIPDELAAFAPLGWLFAVGGPLFAMGMAWWVWSQRHAKAQPAA